MVRLIEKDDLSDVMGHLGRAFGKELQATLRHSFLSVAPPAKKAEAAQAFDELYSAESNLRASRKNLFNGPAQRLTDRLPDQEQFTAMKRRQRAKEAVLALSREIGERIVRQAAQHASNAPTKPRLPFPRP
mgnify:CR=1 FL=1